MAAAKKNFKKEILFIIGLSSLCITILMLTRVGVGSRSEVTGGTVQAILSIVAGSPAGSVDEAFTIFNRRFEQIRSGKIKAWQNQDLTNQWAFEATGAAMWGEMTIVGVMDLETSALLGLRVVNQNETAGLGSKVAEPIFAEQFVGLSFSPKVELSRSRFQNNQFDAVSGATVTSRALEGLLNKAIEAVGASHRKKCYNRSAGSLESGEHASSKETESNE